MKKLAYISTTAALFATPLMAFAAGEQLKNFVQYIGDILNMLIPILIAAALVVFFWGLVVYLYKSTNGKEEGRKIMVWGIIVLFIMVSVWGIVRIAQSTLGVPNVTSVSAPKAPQY